MHAGRGSTLWGGSRLTPTTAASKIELPERQVTGPKQVCRRSKLSARRPKRSLSEG